ENRIVTATYRNLMIGAKVVLVDKASDQQLPDPVTTIASPVPAGSLRIRLPATVKPGDYYLKALNGHGASVALSVEFYVS
ncbi:MAG: hypothetical protein Q7U92_08905, partial [Bradyrhizobium sp.]|nr:hypothetical protein [Bradyrhizobium sp.]